MTFEATDGCTACRHDDPAHALKARAGLQLVREIVDESHYRVTVLRCGECMQPFVGVMTETIDWIDGEDPACRQTMMISRAEADVLAAQDDLLAEESVYALGADGRRCLVDDRPRVGEPRVFWGVGLMRYGHD